MFCQMVKDSSTYAQPTHQFIERLLLLSAQVVVRLVLNDVQPKIPPSWAVRQMAKMTMEAITMHVRCVYSLKATSESRTKLLTGISHLSRWELGHGNGWKHL
ncbi:hypothetical protein BC835DRAFT_1302800 [Cytidiella melzeri]|nr:hypothetical protein BC835DRAFT_1302800 [Cytidiella melzeri]